MTFAITAGPNAGAGDTVLTGANGDASWTYAGSGGPGTDTIEASATLPGTGGVATTVTDTASKIWVTGTVSLTVQTDGNGTFTPSPAPLSSTGTATDMIYQYALGSVVTLTAAPGAGQAFARWTIGGAGTPPYGKGWASPLTITLAALHTATAIFAARPGFSDVPSSPPSYTPITELTARGIIKGDTQQGCIRLNTALPCFGPGDRTQRAQTAALLIRLLGLEGENHGNGGFTDLDYLAPELQSAVGTVAFYGIMQEYGAGKFGSFDDISYLQTAQVIALGLVFKGYWTRATADDPTVYPNVILSPAERLDLVTFVQNAGRLAGFGNGTARPAGPARRAQLDGGGALVGPEWLLRRRPAR